MTWELVNQHLKGAWDALDSKPVSEDQYGKLAARALGHLLAAREAAGRSFARVYVDHKVVSIPKVIDAQEVTLKTIMNRRIVGERFEQLASRMTSKIAEIVDAIQIKVGYESSTVSKVITSSVNKVERKKTTLNDMSLLKDAWLKYQVEQGMMPANTVELKDQIEDDPDAADKIRREEFENFRQEKMVESFGTTGAADAQNVIERLMKTRYGPKNYAVTVRATVLARFSHKIPYSEMRAAGVNVDVLAPVYMFHDQRLVAIYHDPERGQSRDPALVLREVSRRLGPHTDLLAESSRQRVLLSAPYFISPMVRHTHFHWIMPNDKLLYFTQFLVVDASIAW